MTPTLDKFAAHLAELNGTVPHLDFVEGIPPTAKVPAKHELVGNIIIYDDGDELTIEIGHKHHSHFSAYNYGQHPEAERLGLAAEDAALFVNDVMHDRVIITVDYIGDRCVSSSHCYVDGKETSAVRGIGVGTESGDRRSDRFLWSGPIT